MNDGGDRPAAGFLVDQLATANAAELEALVEAHLDRLDPQLARLVLRNPFVTAELIDRLAAAPALAVAYEFRRDTVRHPRTPRVLALRWAVGLYWADLVAVGADIRVQPVVRRAADKQLIERLPGLATGERMAVARAAGPAVIAAVRTDPTPRVIGALLDNPRLTEGLLLPLAAGAASAPRVLELLAGSPRWAVRPALRAALCRNPATPPAAALALLPLLSKRDLAAVATDARISAAVRRRAELLGGARSGPRPPSGGR